MTPYFKNCAVFCHFPEQIVAEMDKKLYQQRKFKTNPGKCVDHMIMSRIWIYIIIAPVLIGGKDTSTLIDGKSLTEECELSKLGVVKLQECVVLENSYLRLRYEVIH